MNYFVLLLISSIFPTFAGKLTLAIIYHRHGARGPLIGNYNPANLPIGELTDVGRRQMFRLGQEIKKYLNDQHSFGIDHYNEEEITFRSTASSRTKVSANCMALGLFPYVSYYESFPCEGVSKFLKVKEAQFQSTHAPIKWEPKGDDILFGFNQYNIPNGKNVHP